MLKFKGLFADSSFFSKILLLIATTLFLSIFSVLMWKVFTHSDMNSLASLKTLQFFQTIGIFILPSFVLAFLWSASPRNFLHFDKANHLIFYVSVVLFMLIIIPFINLLSALNQQFTLPESLKSIEIWMKASELRSAKFTEQLLDFSDLGNLLFNLCLIAVLPAIGEELYFRATIQGLITHHKNAIAGIWFAAFVFSAIHFQFYGFLPRMLLGAFFGYLLYWSGNLWLPIMAHFTNNTVVVLFYFFKNNGYNLPDVDKIGTGSTLWLGVLSAAFGVLGVFLLKKQLLKQH